MADFAVPCLPGCEEHLHATDMVPIGFRPRREYLRWLGEGQSFDDELPTPTPSNMPEADR